MANLTKSEEAALRIVVAVIGCIVAVLVGMYLNKHH